MANRNLLHKSKLEDFKAWLIDKGWTVQEGKSTWEVMRARNCHRNEPLIVYAKKGLKEHYSIMERDIDIVKGFIEDCKSADFDSKQYETPREILFRAKDRVERWVYGYYVKEDETNHFIYDGYIDEFGTDKIKINPSTLGQYTSKKDCKTKRIFEGDKVRYIFDDWAGSYYAERTVEGVIEFCEGSFELVVSDGWSYSLRHIHEEESLEVIGNIYE